MARKSTQTSNWLENYNDSKASVEEGFVGMGNDITGRNYSPAWNGQFQMGGNLPGITGNMYTRIGAPSNGKYAKKTLPSAQVGKEIIQDIKPGMKMSSTTQPYENTTEWTRQQYEKRQIPTDYDYVMSYFERNPKINRVTSGTTIDETGQKWPNMIVNSTATNTQISQGLDLMGRPAFYDKRGSQLPSTSVPYLQTIIDQNAREMRMKEGVEENPKPVKGKIQEFQSGGNKSKVDSVNNEIMLRQLYRESLFNPKASNKWGAKGLAQLKPIAVKELKDKHNLDIDPFDIKDAMLGHKKIMTTEFNKPWIDKEGSSEAVRTAKALASYNMGPTALINKLNEQKAKGKDIYKSTDWVKDLPEEPRNYIRDITGQNPEFEKNYQKALKNFKQKGAYPIKQQGGVIDDDMGQWNHPGKVTRINSNKITMKNVPYPVLGVSDTGDQQMMYPEQDYKFKGKKVTEYPLAKNGWLTKYK